MNSKQKYFQILGITPTSDKSVIKKAYRKLAFKYHPDVNDSPQAQSEFVKITDAYDILLGVKKSPKSRVNSKANSSPNPDRKSTKEEKEERVKAARARYEQAKKRELEEEAQYYLKLIQGKKWTFLKRFSIVSALFAVLLCVDFVLPTKNEFIVLDTVSTNNAYSIVSFELENSEHYFDYSQTSSLKYFPLIEVHFTPIFNDFKSLSYVGGPEKSQFIQPVFCYLYFFPIVITLLFIPLFTVWYKRPTPIFSILHKISVYVSPVLFLIICISNWRIFQIFL